MIKKDDIVYIFKFNKKIKTKIDSIYEYDDDIFLYIADLKTNFPYGSFGFYREEIFTKKDLRKLKMKILINEN